MIFVVLAGLVVALAFWAAAVIHADNRKPHQCEVCGRFLSDRQAVEITESYPDELGGTSMTATFCKKDRP